MMVLRPLQTICDECRGKAPGCWRCGGGGKVCEECALAPCVCELLDLVPSPGAQDELEGPAFASGPGGDAGPSLEFHPRCGSERESLDARDETDSPRAASTDQEEQSESTGVSLSRTAVADDERPTLAPAAADPEPCS